MVRDSTATPRYVTVRGCPQRWREWYNQCYTRYVKTAISIPDSVFRSAEQLAARLGVSRSQLYTKALSAIVAKHRDDLVKSRLDEVYGSGGAPSSLDPGLASAPQRSLAPGQS